MFSLKFKCYIYFRYFLAIHCLWAEKCFKPIRFITSDFHFGILRDFSFSILSLYDSTFKLMFTQYTPNQSFLVFKNKKGKYL